MSEFRSVERDVNETMHCEIALSEMEVAVKDWCEPEETEEDVRARAAAEWDELMLETGAALLASSARSRNITVNAESSDKPNSDDKLFVDDIRDYFGCGRTSAYKILKVLPSKKVGGRVFVYRRDLEAYMREHGGIYTGEKYKLRMLNER